MEETAAHIFRRVKTLMDYMGSMACLKPRKTKT
jgi:hypothetical protein